MSDHTRATMPTEPDLTAQLDAWGQGERSRLVAPPEPFIRQVRAARGPQAGRRVVLRIIQGLALAAAVALVASVAFWPAPSSKPQDTPVVRSTREETPTTLAGMTRRAVETGTLDWLLESAPPPAAAPAAPARAADAYCAGCIEELTKL